MYLFLYHLYTCDVWNYLVQAPGQLFQGASWFPFNIDSGNIMVLVHAHSSEGHVLMTNGYHFAAPSAGLLH